jgi:peptidoglycan/LPS O-acetylase OafA/YrhL
VFITTIFGLFFLGDVSLHDLSESGLKSFYAISNHYFYSSGGYFDLLNRERPLLHTWTLSIELQFYFLWAILFFIIGSRSNRLIINTLLVLIFLSILSSLVAVFFYQMERAVFFLMPFRLYEFALGGLSFYIINVLKKTTGRQGINYNNSIILLSTLPILLYFLIDAMVVLNISISLLIFILILRFADKNFRINIFFERLVKSLSVNTYTIYLVHFPIIIFLSYAGFEKAELILYSIILISLFTFLVNYLVRLIRLL